jgi:hypothetical protein
MFHNYLSLPQLMISWRLESGRSEIVQIHWTFKYTERPAPRTGLKTTDVKLWSVFCTSVPFPTSHRQHAHRQPLLWACCLHSGVTERDNYWLNPFFCDDNTIEPLVSEHPLVVKRGNYLHSNYEIKMSLRTENTVLSISLPIPKTSQTSASRLSFSSSLPQDYRP